MKSKKALGVVIATSLFLVVAIVATIGFQMWFNTYSSQNYANVETKGSSIADLKIEAIIDNVLYITSNKNTSPITLNIYNKNNDLLCSYSPGDVSNNLSDYLMSDFNFEDYNGSHTSDSSSLNNLGLVSGANHITDCLVGSCFEFDGVDDYIEIIENNTFKLMDSDFTISILSNRYSTDSNRRALFAHGGPVSECCDSEGYPGVFIYWISSSSEAKIEGNQTGITSRIISNSTYSDIQIPISFILVRSNETLTLYRNGEIYAQNTTMFSSDDNLDTTGWGLGARVYWTQSLFFNGTLDEFKVYNKTLTSDEISNLYYFNSPKISLMNNTNTINLPGCNITEGETYEVVAFTPTSSIQQKVVAK